MSLINDCLIQSGLNLTGCTKNNVGGVSEIFFANYKDLIPTGSGSEEFVYDDTTTGEITAITGATPFYRYDCVKETSSLSEAVAVNVQNSTIAFTPTITFVANKMTTESRNLVYLLSLGLLIAVVKDNNTDAANPEGNYWMVGFKRGLDVTAVENATGTALGDRNGHSITVTGNEPVPMARLSSAAVAQLVALATY